MTTIAQDRFAKRLLLLFVLLGTLIYLRYPEPAQAYTCSCYVGCLSVYARCKTLCNGNQTCINNCWTSEQQCQQYCNQTHPECCGVDGC